MAVKRMKKHIIVMVVFTLLISLFINIGFNAYAQNNEIVDSFYILDEDGNPHLIQKTQKELNQLQKEEENKTYTVSIKNEDMSEIVGEYDSIEEANQAYNDTITFLNEVNLFTAEGTTTDVVITEGNDTIATTTPTYGVVRFNLSKSTINYTEIDTGNTGYISPASTGDAAYIRTEEDGVVCKVSGVVMKVALSNVKAIEDYKNNTISNYYINGGYLYHRYSYYDGTNITSASTKIGYSKNATYLKSGTTYYSYDGHYFYNNFETMINDYQNNTYDHSVNKDQPFYNYYQYLSLHTKANFTADEYDTYIASYKKTGSVLNNAGTSFVNTQNHYTVNSLLMLGVAINESGWGLSKYATQRYNLFGINAIDSNPDQADYFDNVEECLNYWAYNMVSSGYLNGTDSRYRGPHLGDKHSGLNVKYASDPYWGEKAAARGYVPALEKYDDVSRYSLAIAQKTIRAYKEPSTSSTRLYTTSTSGDKVIYDYPLTVLGSVTTNGVKFYKVRSDMPLKDDRSYRNVEAIYNASRDYVYVLASDVTLVFEGNGENISDEYNYVEPEVPETPVEPEVPVVPEKTHDEVLTALKLTHSNGYLTGFTLGGNVSSVINTIKALDERIVVSVKDKDGNTVTSATITTGMTISITTESKEVKYTCVIRGDVNGDGKISPADYVKVKNKILGKEVLKNSFLIAGDVTKDNNITPADYVKIKNNILGKEVIN